MIKPTYENKPSWANYLAQDENSQWTWFEYEPVAQYANSGYWLASKGRYEQVEYESGIQWMNTLEVI